MDVPEPGLDEYELAGGGRTRVARRGQVVHRESGPWSATVLDLLRYLDHAGFQAAPKVEEPGFDADGRETLRFVARTSAHPRAWPARVLPQIGDALRQLHQLTRLYRPPTDAVWQPWFGRKLGDGGTVIGHCDAAPWNIIVNDDRVFLLDWETAGPVDPLVELAQVCWLNAQLHDDDVAELQGLGSPAERAADMRAIVDGYELPASPRRRLPQLMIEVALQDAAQQLRAAAITPETTESRDLWAIAWRTRAASWMLTNRQTLERALD